ncbi:LamG domain-containing protein [Deltaproteobacteria bacterium]|nr:LamG domain-containing protein [Deltaproteobacteria bacterium]
MKKILNIILVSCFSLTVISCGLITEEESSTTTAAVDTSAPTAGVTTATITTSENAVVQSTETGTAYLVNTAVTVSNLASITGAADNQSNSVTISSAATNTNLPATGLADGTYKVYAVDAAGNISSASSNSVTLRIDYALDFDGNNDNVSANGVATELASSTNLPLSVSAWVYPDNGTKQQLVFGFYRRISAFKNGPSVRFGGTDFKFAYDSDNDTTVHSSSTYEINNWHHVVLTIGSNRDGVLYVNGSSAATFSGAHNSGGLDMFSIAVDYDDVVEESTSYGAGSPTQYFDGKIDEVAVWNDELTSAEVTAIYNSGNMLNVSSDSGNYASADNLSGYYRFNEGSGTSFQDNSSNSNTGTITGATWTAGFVSE